MRFNIGNGRGRKLRIRERGANDGLLGETIGRGENVGPAVLIDGGTANDGVDVVVVAERVDERPENDNAATFAGDEAVGSSVESFAEALGREHAELGHGDVMLGKKMERDAAGKSEIAFAGAKGLAGEMHGDERGGAGGIDGNAGAAKIEKEGEAPGGDAVRATSGSVGSDGSGIFEEEARVIGIVNGDENSRR